MNRTRVYPDRDGRPWVISLSSVILALSVSACREEAEPPTPPKPAAYTAQEAATKLESLQLDDDFFANLDELKDHAKKPGADPALLKALFRFELDAVAAGVASDPEAGKRMLRANPGEPAAVGEYLSKWSARLKSGGEEEQAATIAALGAAWGTGPMRDLGPLFVKAASDTPEAPAVRLVLAKRLFDVISEAADAHENERGKLVTSRVPGFPSPMTRDLEHTVFPAAMRLFAMYLEKGQGSEAGLGPHYAKLKADAKASLEGRYLPLSISLGSSPRPGTPIAGVTGAYEPLVVVSLFKDLVSLGARPAFAWNEGTVSNATGSQGWPGKPFAKVDEIADPEVRKEHEDKFAAALAQAEAVAAPIEASAYAARFPPESGVLNADRSDRSHSILVAVDQKADSEALKDLLSVVQGAGVRDLKLLQTGQPGVILPVFFEGVPRYEGVGRVSRKRALILLSSRGADVYPPPRKGGWKLPTAGWPEGTQVVKDRKRFFKLFVPWHEARGFQGAVSASIEKVCEKATCGPVVNVVIKTDGTSSAAVLDLAAEIEAARGPAFEKIASYFPGTVCSETSPCPSKVPVLFAKARVPRPSKPEVEVKETRPAGFCEKSAVARVMRGRSGAYRACYEMQLQRHPELSGRIHVRFTIEPNGSVSGVKTIKNELNAKVAKCIVKQVYGLRFPKPDGGVCVIRWPFKFQPGG